MRNRNSTIFNYKRNSHIRQSGIKKKAFRRILCVVLVFTGEEKCSDCSGYKIFSFTFISFFPQYTHRILSIFSQFSSPTPSYCVYLYACFARKLNEKPNVYLTTILFLLLLPLSRQLILLLLPFFSLLFFFCWFLMNWENTAATTIEKKKETDTRFAIEIYTDRQTYCEQLLKTISLTFAI